MTGAWTVNGYGEPGEVLRWGQVPEPHPIAGQVRVRTAATSCNFADVLLCRGQYQQKPRMPFTPGLEVCGTVDAVGEGISAQLLGTRVVGQPALPHGGFAETAIMDAAHVYPVPEALDSATAATLHLTYLTAWLGLHRRATTRPGDTVVVTAAAGGVGSAAVQIARAAGARVIGIAGAEKLEAVADLGADVVIDRADEQLVERVLDAATGGVRVVFDPVGGQAYESATKYVGFEGVIVVVGFASGTIPQPRLNHAFVKNYTIAGLHWTLYRRQNPKLLREAQTEIFRMAVDGEIAPLITGRVGLDAVPATLQDLGEGRTLGKVVVEI